MQGNRLLLHTSRVFEDRHKEYGDARQHFDQVAKRWSLTLGQEGTPAQVVLCLQDLKHTRLCHNPGHLDSIADVAGYAAVLAELVPNQRGLFDAK